MNGFKKRHSDGQAFMGKPHSSKGVSQDSMNHHESISISKSTYPTKRLAWTEAGKKTGWKPKEVKTIENPKSFKFVKTS